MIDRETIIKIVKQNLCLYDVDYVSIAEQIADDIDAQIVSEY